MGYELWVMGYELWVTSYVRKTPLEGYELNASLKLEMFLVPAIFNGSVSFDPSDRSIIF
jgi:hypothetical protein